MSLVYLVASLRDVDARSTDEKGMVMARCLPGIALLPSRSGYLGCKRMSGFHDESFGLTDGLEESLQA
jgi:hypothetical protein